MITITEELIAKWADHIDGDVYIDRFHRYLVSTDGSIYQKLPAAVVYPKSTEDVVKTVQFAAAKGLAVHPRGAGSGLCGSCLGSGLILDFTRYMNQLISIKIEEKTFECLPGYRFGELQAELSGKGLFFPPDPSSGEYATFGGMYATNASGAHSVKYGNVSDYILDAEVVLADGKVIRLSDIEAQGPEALPENLKALSRLYQENAAAIEKAYPDINNNVAGYNLRGLVKTGRLCLGKLFAGAEGTLGIVTRLKFRLSPKPAHDSLVVAFFSDIIRSAKAVQQILPMGPAGIEIMDKSLLSLAKENDEALRDKIPDGIDNLLLIEFDALEKEHCAGQAQKVQALLKDQGLSDQAQLAVSEQEKEKFWAVRKAAVPILYKLKGSKKAVALIEDAVVPVERLVPYFEGIYRILGHHHVDFVIYGHIAKGLLHARPLLDLKDREDIALMKPLADELFDLVRRLGGVVSGEHGDGRLRSAFIKVQYPEIYDLFVRTKRLLDEENIFNPEIKTEADPDLARQDFRFGSDYQGTDPDDKALSWPEGFVQEVEKCHGCAKCTTTTLDTRMCPIYKFTRDERAAPRAKANILRALISGAVSDRDLYEEIFQQVIHQCVGCGSCAYECPSGVNIPKMVLEAKAQYVNRFGASLLDRLVSHLELAARGTRRFSAALNPLMGSSVVRQAGERMVGLSAQRDMIVFPPQSLFQRVDTREGRGNKAVLFFAGCYGTYIRPEVGEAAIQILKALGFNVHIPQQHCCGLPMMAKGMIKPAGKKIRKNLKEWHYLVDQSEHIVVTCPSCGLALMKEWAYIIEDKDIQKISQKVIHISRLTNQHLNRLNLKPLAIRAAYHMSCHLKLLPEPECSVTLLSQVPESDIIPLKSHCCGMAGSWGLTARHFGLSKKIGDHMMAGLDASGAEAGITDCPTCRLQMEQFGTKKIWHPVEIIAQCL